MLLASIIRFLRNMLACFMGPALLGQFCAIALTYVIVTTGLDWQYFEATRDPALFRILFPAAIIGFLVPTLFPFAIYIIGLLHKNRVFVATAFAIAQAEGTAYLISIFYKALTGRAHPMPHSVLLTDITRDFQFGFFERGIFWGWPSSHTAVAFAMAAVLFTLFPHKRYLTVPALVYALYIGIGVSTTIHWFSDFVAGAIVGTIAGVIVGKSFLKRRLI